MQEINSLKLPQMSNLEDLTIEQGVLVINAGKNCLKLPQMSNLESLTIEQRILDTNAGKQLYSLSCHRCLINTGVEKMNNI